MPEKVEFLKVLDFFYQRLQVTVCKKYCSVIVFLFQQRDKQKAMVRNNW